MGHLTEFAKQFLEGKQQVKELGILHFKESPIEALAPNPPVEDQCFTLNAGCHIKTPAIRETLFPPDSRVTVKSPAFGEFEATVLKDDGVTLWVFNPFTQRETAVPNGWIIGEAHD